MVSGPVQGKRMQPIPFSLLYLAFISLLASPDNVSICSLAFVGVERCIEVYYFVGV